MRAMKQAERPGLRRWTRHEYERLIDHGFLDEDDTIELRSAGQWESGLRDWTRRPRRRWNKSWRPRACLSPGHVVEFRPPFAGNSVGDSGRHRTVL
jgi:hypothetical protein